MGVLYKGMIVGSRYNNIDATIMWVGFDSALYSYTGKFLGLDSVMASPFLHNGDLYALIINYNKQPYDCKVVKVSGSLECSCLNTSSLLKMIDANTYIYIPVVSCEQCLRVEFVGDACNIEVLPHNGFDHYDGERYWTCKRICSDTMQYISSDPAYNFEMPNRFGSTKDTRNGKILNFDVKQTAEGRYTIYILCSRTRDVIWTYKFAIGERYYYYTRVAFVTDNVVIMLTATARISIFINTVDNTEYELAFCG